MSDDLLPLAETIHTHLLALYRKHVRQSDSTGGLALTYRDHLKPSSLPSQQRAYTTRIDGSIREFLALPIIGRPRDLLYDAKKGDEKTMRAAFTLREERAHETEAMLDAAFGDPAAFLPEIVAPGAGGGGAAKSLALASAVKKGREREKALAAMPPHRRMYIGRRARLAACAARIRGKTGPRPFAAVLDRLEAASREKRRRERTEEERAEARREKRKRAAADRRAAASSSLPLPPKPSTEAPAVPEGEAAAERAAQREREKQLQVKRALERKAAREREEARERQRAEREEADRKRREAEQESPREALARVYGPMFTKLWDMEFLTLGGMNPFRTVIDAGNCADLGVADYCDVVKKPMNLTWIKAKVEEAAYESLEDFFNDVELMINNSILYNSDPKNDFHIVAQDMKRYYRTLARSVIKKLQVDASGSKDANAGDTGEDGGA